LWSCDDGFDTAYGCFGETYHVLCCEKWVGEGMKSILSIIFNAWVGESTSAEGFPKGSACPFVMYTRPRMTEHDRIPRKVFISGQAIYHIGVE
jgi:hypothetical protein